MILTSHGYLGQTGRQTGVYLPELAHPYEVFSKAGWDITVASPLGGDAPIDPKSISPELANYVQYAKNTLPLTKIPVEDYDAYFVVGGHGTMWDLPDNEDLQRLLTAAYANGKVVSAVCHGPSALVRLKNPDGSYLIHGKHVAGFTNEEEQAAGLTEVVPFLLEDALKNAGAIYEKSQNWREKVVVDGHLVTGQNPASAKGAAEAVVRILDGK